MSALGIASWSNPYLEALFYVSALASACFFGASAIASAVLLRCFCNVSAFVSADQVFFGNSENKPHMDVTTQNFLIGSFLMI